ncbi:unnamed protein product [Cyprideis torosa]|uniref:Glycosyl transferase family 25 domain-containing protein n=1 Tax=Cyprideis torosa TaxID=163714 RepID=A0A7R8W6F1_9CRUS|nr:unnamed protein product [Cyprideis torosa]CAG0885155.1 unnamed protein product [Cyprideis torosa]
MQAVRRGPLFHLEEFEKAGFKETFPQPTPLPHIDKVFVINLKRRPEKRERMDYLLKLMGIEYTLIEAFDGQLLSKEDLQLLNVGLPPTGYYDGYRDFKRIGISAGATGLTLTSVALWSQIIQDESLNSVLVLEDDCHFTDADNFRDGFQRVMEELISYDPNWELLYLGRKMFEGFYGTSLTWPDSGENLEFVEKPGHSHWTVAMAISRSGVRKLLKGNPLRYLVPLDEYIPVMGGIHLDRELMELHPTSGSLNMYGLYRQLIWPMIFVFEPGYITDTLDDNDKNILPVSWFINSADVDGAVEFFVEEIPGVVQDSSLNQDRSSYKEYFAELAKFLESYLIPNNTTGNPVTSRGCESIAGDATCDIMDWWIQTPIAKEYADVDLVSTNPKPYWKLDDPGLYQWNTDDRRRMTRVMELRQESLGICRRKGIPWLFSLDGDVLFSDFNIIQKLIDATTRDGQIGIIAPFVTGSNQDANFLALKASNEDLMMLDGTRYLDILHTYDKDNELRDVEFVHAAVLINLGHRKSLQLAFHPDFLPDKGDGMYKANAPFNEFITLSVSARSAGMKIKYFREKYEHGYMTARQVFFKTPEEEIESERFAKTSAVRRGPLFELGKFEEVGFLEKFPESSPLPFIDQVFVINLKRRADKKQRMDYVLKQLGLNYTLIEAIDGESLTKKDLQELEIGLPPLGYANVYQQGRRHLGITAGSAALTITSVLIWNQMMKDSSINAALVLEDDCHFMSDFRDRFEEVMEEMKSYDPDWDLLYLGRKMLTDHPNSLLTYPGEEHRYLERVCRPGYSHWTIAMVISRAGAEKLLRGNPLEHIVPLDEYIPLMGGIHFDQDLIDLHPAAGSLRVYGLYDQLIEPMRFSSESGHISDTEDYVETLPIDWFRNAQDVKQMAGSNDQIFIPVAREDMQEEADPVNLWVPSPDAIYENQLSELRASAMPFNRPPNLMPKFYQSYAEFEDAEENEAAEELEEAEVTNEDEDTLPPADVQDKAESDYVAVGEVTGQEEASSDPTETGPASVSISRRNSAANPVCSTDSEDSCDTKCADPSAPDCSEALAESIRQKVATETETSTIKNMFSAVRTTLEGMFS